MEAFKSGDVVVLKSGGPRMTISGPVADDKYLCEWFDGSKVSRDVFDVGSLRLVE